MNMDDEDAFFEFYADNVRPDLTAQREATRTMMTYWPPFPMVIATFTHIITVIVLFKMMRRVLSTCMYVFVGLMADLLVLYIRCGNDWLHNMAGMDVADIAQHASNTVCKIYPFISDWVLHLSMWMTVSMAVETTLVTLRPQRMIWMCKLERGRAVILLLIVLLVCVNAHNFWTFALIKREQGEYKEEVCTNSRQGNQLSNEFIQVAWPIINILVSDLLPICICFSCSVMLITRRTKRAEQVKTLENTWKAYSIDAKTARQLQISFLVVALLQVILLLPKLGFDIFSFVSDQKLKLVKFSPLLLDVRRQLASAACNSCLYILLACKPFVFFAVCRGFRLECVRLFLCRCCHRNHSGLAHRVSTQQPLLNTVCSNSNSNHAPHPEPLNRKMFSTTSV